jgi:hypothetical protein
VEVEAKETAEDDLSLLALLVIVVMNSAVAVVVLHLLNLPLDHSITYNTNTNNKHNLSS